VVAANARGLPDRRWRASCRRAAAPRMPLEVAAAMVIHLVPREYCEEAGRRPTFFVGLRGERPTSV
jgi:hypothetical protein